MSIERLLMVIVSSVGEAFAALTASRNEQSPGRQVALFRSSILVTIQSADGIKSSVTACTENIFGNESIRNAVQEITIVEVLSFIMPLNFVR